VKITSMTALAALAVVGLDSIDSACAQSDAQLDAMTKAHFHGMSTSDFLTHCGQDARWCAAQFLWVDATELLRSTPFAADTCMPNSDPQGDDAYVKMINDSAAAWLRANSGSVSADAPTAIVQAIHATWPAPCARKS
jgi:hypothetical protein